VAFTVERTGGQHGANVACQCGLAAALPYDAVQVAFTFGKKAAFRRQCIETDLSEFPLSELLFSEMVLQPLPLKPDPLPLEPDPLPLSELLLSEMVFQSLPLKPDPLPLEPLSLLGLQSRRIRRRVRRNRKERPLLLERSNA
jgi:hypothetical protein